MEIRVLRYFLEAAREENITKAAAFLHVSQPTLSRQLKELEEELGRPLFVRSSHRIHLTDEGQLLRKRAEDILDMVDKTASEFKSLDEITGGDIRIGCAESSGLSFFHACGARCAEALPEYPFPFLQQWDGCRDGAHRQGSPRHGRHRAERRSFQVQLHHCPPTRTAGESLPGTMIRWPGNPASRSMN